MRENWKVFKNWVLCAHWHRMKKSQRQIKKNLMWGYLMVKGRIFVETKEALSTLTACVLQTLVLSSTVSTLNSLPLNLVFKQNRQVEKQASVYEALFGFLGHWPWILYVLSESLTRVGFQSSLSQMWTYKYVQSNRSTSGKYTELTHYCLWKLMRTEKDELLFFLATSCNSSAVFAVSVPVSFSPFTHEHAWGKFLSTVNNLILNCQLP